MDGVKTMKWCTISEVQNGWIVKTTPDYTCNRVAEDGMFVFRNPDELAEWVKMNFNKGLGPIVKVERL